MKIRDKIREAIKKHKGATKIYLSDQDEIALVEELDFDSVGNLVEQILIQGIRAAVPTIFGKEVIWGAKELRAE